MLPSDDSRVRELAAVDEILQVMYWLRGERLAADMDARDLARFVTIDPAEIAPLLERLAAQGLITPVASSTDGSSPPRYALTEAGGREGGRRFADEFADLTKPGHGECADPDCECHRTGSVDDCKHRRVD